MDEQTYNRLLQLWDGSAEYVQADGTLYRVLTPDGPGQPLFVPVVAQDLYGSTSTSKIAPEPGQRVKPPRGQVIKPRKQIEDVSDE